MTPRLRSWRPVLPWKTSLLMTSHGGRLPDSPPTHSRIGMPPWLLLARANRSPSPVGVDCV
eukprot:COSAG06_NODE_913_length_11579_cov_25.672387_13_plen_61_part_00